VLFPAAVYKRRHAEDRPDLGLIPSDVHAGVYHFTGLLTFKINSLTTVSYPLYTNDFTIVEN
jgi:hypothetical protein